MMQFSNVISRSPTTQRRRAGEPRRSVHDLDLALLGEPVEPFREPVDDRCLPADQRRDVDRRVAERDRRARPSPRPRRSLARRAAAPWRGCSRRSGTRRRGARSARRARPAVRGRRRGTRPCSRRSRRRGRPPGSRDRRRRRGEVRAARARARRRRPRLESAASGSLGPAPSVSSVISTLPSDTRSPIATRSCVIVPASGAGTSIVALSDSSVTSGSSTAISSPGATWISITGTSVKSPMSGTRISDGVTTAPGAGPTAR